MIVYHEVEPESLNSVLQDGIKRTSRGDKGDDSAIAQTDKFLDKHRPEEMRKAHVSRDNNIYAFIADDGYIIDITDGNTVGAQQFAQNSEQVLLRLTVDPTYCYVSNLDLCDALKQAIEAGKDDKKLQELAERYWGALVPLTQFTVGDIRRPEVMITDDVSASCIEIVSGG